MDGDAARAALLGEKRGFDRIGNVDTARLSDGSDVIDIDAEEKHKKEHSAIS
jgi:hypothetical protein